MLYSRTPQGNSRDKADKRGVEGFIATFGEKGVPPIVVDGLLRVCKVDEISFARTFV